MWTTRLVPRVFKSPSILRQTSLITSVPQRNFCFRWGKKYRDIYGPSSWNTPEKRYDSNHRMGQVKERTQDPLYIDDRIKHIDGGISAYITRLHDEKIYDIPLRSMAFILYNEAREKRNEKLVYKRFEENYHRLISTSIVAREAFGGLWACYQSN